MLRVLYCVLCLFMKCLQALMAYAASHLRDPFRWNKTCGLNDRKSCLWEHINQTDLHLCWNEGLMDAEFVINRNDTALVFHFTWFPQHFHHSMTGLRFKTFWNNYSLCVNRVWKWVTTQHRAVMLGVDAGSFRIMKTLHLLILKSISGSNLYNLHPLWEWAWLCGRHTDLSDHRQAHTHTHGK